MEIERKFLLQEKNTNYPSEFNIEDLKKEITTNGKEIIQSYLPKKLIPEILKKLNQKIDFNPSQIRIRKYGKDYFLTIKSKGTIERNEFEINISKEQYSELILLRKKFLKKTRLVKKIDKHYFEFDLYKNYNLIVIEIEFESLKEANDFKTKMKDITTNKRYSNSKLAK